MKTSKPISTISFNSVQFLKLKLEYLRTAKRISWWCFIVHHPEDDEGGKKEHIHLYIEPSKMLQTDDLKLEFLEPDLEKPNKPKSVLSFHSSKFSHWYLYALHDRHYLASKGQSRRFSYKHDDFHTCDSDDLLCRARSIDHLELSPYAQLIDALEAGLTWVEFLKRGTVPVNHLFQFKDVWRALEDDRTYRNGRKGHENE